MPESMEPASAAESRRPPRLWLRRMGWMLLIWSASVAALGAVALGLRLVMRLIGMTP
ncbi:MAG TPA: DUF2474 domain-containing protein [Herbaspirillum sp.]|jgi:hypothetical protein